MHLLKPFNSKTQLTDYEEDHNHKPRIKIYYILTKHFYLITIFIINYIL